MIIVVLKTRPERIFATHTDAQLAEVLESYPLDLYDAYSVEGLYRALRPTPTDLPPPIAPAP